MARQKRKSSTKSPRCSDCRFYCGMMPTAEKTDPVGECRRYPPQVSQKVSIGTEGDNGVYYTVGDSDDVHLFPAVSASEWCGEFLIDDKRRKHGEKG